MHSGVQLRNTRVRNKYIFIVSDIFKLQFKVNIWSNVQRMTFLRKPSRKFVCETLEGTQNKHIQTMNPDIDGEQK